MLLLEIVILFGLAFCFVNSVKECNNELDLDCFCYNEPRDNLEYSICVDDPCLSDHLGVNYRRVGQRCIYFDKSTSNYDVARERCKSTFSGKGRIYQPRNFEESVKIAVEGKSKFNLIGWWIGVNDINEEGKFVFESDGSPIPFTPTWQNKHISQPDCVLVYPSMWQIYKCSDTTQIGTLCEYGE